LEESSE